MRHDPRTLTAYHEAGHAVLGAALFASDDALAREVDRLYDIARASLGAVWPAVTRLAKALLENETLNTTDIQVAIGDIDIRRPVLLVQRAHETWESLDLRH